MSISRRAALNPAHSHALLLCISSVSGNKIVAAALLRHAQRSARLPCSTPTAVEGGVALKPHACRRISRQSAASRALAAETRSHRSWSGEGAAKGGEGVQCAADLAKRGRGADVVERREEDGDRNMEEGELSCLARAMLKLSLYFFFLLL
jgi:hypothetical protein